MPPNPPAPARLPRLNKRGKPEDPGRDRRECRRASAARQRNHCPELPAVIAGGKDRAAAQTWDGIMERASAENPKGVN